MENSDVQPQDDPSRDQEPASACTGCRRRKLKCSKEAPKCQQCRKSGKQDGSHSSEQPMLTQHAGGDCVYDNKRNKSGMKAGAIEGLHRRLGRAIPAYIPGGLQREPRLLTWNRRLGETR